MPLLRRLMDYLLKSETKMGRKRVFLQDEELIALIKDVAREQKRTEEDVVADFTKVGFNQFLSQKEMETRWFSLSHREQQIVALVCLGYRNDEIAKALVITPDTVKKHLQRIFDKFNLHSRKELRIALKNWEFREWWEQNQQD